MHIWIIPARVLWVTRWLQVGDGPLLRTTYVEAVAADPARRRRGYASAALQAVIPEVRHFDRHRRRAQNWPPAPPQPRKYRFRVGQLMTRNGF